MKNKRWHSGFTLIELMIVVAIIGILAALAIPAFMRYIKRSQTSEALLNLRKIYDGEVSYYNIDHIDRAGDVVSAQFVAAGPQPSVIPSATRILGNWTDRGWTELKFATDTPIRYRYQAIVSGTGINSGFTARAEGDLDGDNRTSLFERSARINPTDGEVIGAAGVYKANELE